ncbi:MAG: hypothetical protein WBD55_00685 [Dehalococcoidia bacterium]
MNWRTVLEHLGALSAASGLFLLASYVAGRIYLQSYYGVFGVSLSDLDVSLQDIMFASWRSLLPAFLAVAGTIWLIGVTARFSEHLAPVDALISQQEDLLAKHNGWIGRLNAANKRLVLEGHSDDLDRELDALYDEAPSLRTEVEKQIVENQAIRRRMEEVQLYPFVARISGRLPARAPDALFVLFMSSAVVGPSALLWFTEGWRTALLVLGLNAVTLAGGGLVLYFGYTLVSPSHAAAKPGLPMLVVIILLLLTVTPYVSGNLLGYAEKNAETTDFGQQVVVLASHDQLAPDWTDMGNEFVSPELRYVGQGQGFIVVRRADGGNDILKFPSSEILRVQQP